MWHVAEIRGDRNSGQNMDIKLGIAPKEKPKVAEVAVPGTGLNLGNQLSNTTFSMTWDEFFHFKMHLTMRAGAGVQTSLGWDVGGGGVGIQRRPPAICDRVTSP